jgi:hypothetical protein
MQTDLAAMLASHEINISRVETRLAAQAAGSDKPQA